MESSNTPPKGQGLFSYLKNKTGIPPFIYIIFLIAGAVIFKDFFLVYIVFVSIAFVIIKMLAATEPPPERKKTSAYFDNFNHNTSGTISSNVNRDNNDYESIKSEIDSLKTQMFELKKSYKERIGKLDDKLNSLENKLMSAVAGTASEEIDLSETITATPSYSNAAHKPITEKEEVIEQKEVSVSTENEAVVIEKKEEDVINRDKLELKKEEKEVITNSEKVVQEEDAVFKKEIINDDDNFIESLMMPIDKQPAEKQKKNASEIREDVKSDIIVIKEKETREPFVGKLISSIVESVGEQIGESVFGPFSAVLGKAKDLYKHYKDQGKLPVFYLTTAGTIALLLCFAYLLQYSFANIFNEVAKMVFGFVSALALIVGGHFLNRKNGLKEFGSVLIGAGISINFLLIYYASVVYSFVPSFVGFSLLGVNTIAGYLLSMRYETRIAAIVSFLGGAFTPILLGAEKEFITFYLFYLVMISAATIHVARKIKWPTMAQGSVIIVTTLFQFIISKGDRVAVNLIPVHILFYLYMSYVFFRDGKLQDKFTKVIALILIGNMTALLYNTYSLSKDLLQGLVFLGNAIPFIIASKVFWRIMSDLVKTVVLSVISLFILLAIPALMGLDIGSYVWIIEGLLMVYLGSHLKLNTVIKEGYALFFISLIHACWGLGSIVSYGADFSIALSKDHIISLIAVPLFSAAMVFITGMFKSEFKLIDKLVNNVLHTMIWGWFSIAAFLFSTVYISDQSLLIVLSSFLISSFYANKFRVNVGRTLMPILYIGGLIIGSVALLTEYFLVKFSVFQFALLSFLAALYLPLNKYLFIDKNSMEEFLQKVIKEYLIVASVFVSMVIADKLNSDYLLIGITMFIPLLLWISNRFKIAVASFYLQPLLSIVMVVMSVLFLAIENNAFVNSYLVGMILIIAYVLIIDILYSKKILEKRLVFTGELINFSREMVSYTPVLFFLVIAFKLIPQWFWVVSIVPMVYLLVRGAKVKSSVSQYGGFLLLLFPIAGYLKAAVENNTLLITYLPIYAKVAAAEIALMFWGMVHLAGKINLHRGIIKVGKLMNTIFFICLPLFYIPTLFDIVPEFLSVSLLGSIVISYLVAKYLKQKLFYREYMLIWIGAYIVAVFKIVTGSGALISLDTIALLGIIVLAIVHLIIEKSFDAKIYNDSPFKLLFRFYWLSFSVIFTLVPLSVLESFNAAALGFIAWYFIVCRLAYKIPAINKIASSLFKITAWALLILLGNTIGAIFNGDRITINLITGFISVAGICFVLYGSKQSVLRLGIKENKYLDISNRALQWIVHISVTAFLMALTNLFPENYIRPAQSILLLLHAVFLTFHSYSRSYQILIRYAALLYFVFTMKVIFIDLATFSIPQKVFVFMVIAMLMLGASYVLQKRGMKWSVDENDN